MTTTEKRTREWLEEERENTQESFDHAMKKMKRRFKKGDPYATEQYVWPNQVEDAQAILHMMFTLSLLFISVIKQPKLGCNGLMFELIRLVCTHNDDELYIPPDNVFILTGMSNKEWEKTIRKDCPDIIRENVHHRPMIPKIISDIKGKKNLLLVIDEIDVATKAKKNNQQIMHKALEAAGILDIDYMRENNVRIVAISATNCKEMRAMKKFGKEYADVYKMTKPDEYFGVEDMNDMAILKQAPPIKSVSQIEKFIKENGIEYFGENDPRVHMIRGDKNTRHVVKSACDKLGIEMHDHFGVEEKKSHKELLDICLNVKKHCVIFLKNMFGRADFIPNKMKMKIGFWLDKSVKEKSRNANVQLQAAIGRMSGFWKSIINTHKLGYIFTNLNSVREYIAFYRNPSFASVKCHKCDPILQPKYVKNAKEVIVVSRQGNYPLNKRCDDAFRVYQNEADCNEARRQMNYTQRTAKNNLDENGRIKTKLHNFGIQAHDVKNVIEVIKAGKAYEHNGSGDKKKKSWRIKFPCYFDLDGPRECLVWVLQIKPGDEARVRTLDQLLPDHLYNMDVLGSRD